MKVQVYLSAEQTAQAVQEYIAKHYSDFVQTPTLDQVREGMGFGGGNRVQVCYEIGPDDET